MKISKALIAAARALDESCYYVYHYGADDQDALDSLERNQRYFDQMAAIEAVERDLVRDPQFNLNHFKQSIIDQYGEFA